jgi:hypothetical protein
MPDNEIPVGDEQESAAVGFCAYCGQPLADPLAEIQLASE